MAECVAGRGVVDGNARVVGVGHHVRGAGHVRLGRVSVDLEIAHFQVATADVVADRADLIAQSDGKVHVLRIESRGRGRLGRREQRPTPRGGALQSDGLGGEAPAAGRTDLARGATDVRSHAVARRPSIGLTLAPRIRGSLAHSLGRGMIGSSQPGQSRS